MICFKKGAKTHQFSTEELEIIGKSTREVAHRLIEMTHKREPSQPHIRYYILNTELRPVFSCLLHLLQNSEVGKSYSRG